MAALDRLPENSEEFDHEEEDHGEAKGEEQQGEGREEAAPPEKRLVHIEAEHCSVDIEASPPNIWTKLGYFVTFRCAECNIWRVPTAPFITGGEKAVFLETCAFGDTSPVCCNCERAKELVSWRSRTLKVVKKGPKLLDPPMRLMDTETHEIVWDRERGDTMEVYRDIMKEGVYEGSGSERTSWYSEMACNQCRHRVGLPSHEEIARRRAIDEQIRIMEAAAKGKKKGKGKGKGKKKK
mmetsp:Transcript_10480/g.25756  ORF Transcript_10480/g.25756 Transcript_10480/m.25756 type:complete len:238 (+) Transcript_10480:229-942(+)